MTGDSMRMVADDMATVRSRVDGAVRAREKKMCKDDGKGNSEDEAAAALAELEGAPVVVERPAPKSILENKGLVPRRKRADANPRVKHRMKFKKAIVRYHSQVPRSRDDGAHYEGEQSGIRIGVIKARKFK